MLCRVSIYFFLCGIAAVGAEVNPSARFAASYEQEIKGQFQEALAGYREALSVARDQDAGLVSKLLYRVGVGEQRAGRHDEARKAWQELITILPPDSPMAPRAREAIKDLDREGDRFQLRGRVVAPTDGTGSTLPVKRAWVMAGEWGDEPPVVTDTNGFFYADRRSAGQLADGRRYVLVYAEHPELSTAAMAVVFHGEGEPAPLELTLGATLSVTGRVMDRTGRPVAGARIRIAGVMRDEELILVPFDRVIPPVFSDTQGGFRIPGLIPGMRYTMEAERDGYVLDRPVIMESKPEGETRSGNSRSVEPIVMHPMVELSLKGRVIDDTGRGLGVSLAVWTPPPVARQVAATNSDDEGFFVFRGVRENLVSIRAVAEGYLVRDVAGIKPMGQDVDIVMKRDTGARVNAFAGTADATLMNADPMNASAGASNATRRANATWISGLRWLRGGSLNGDALRDEDLRGKVVVLRFSSAYVDASLARQYPDEPRLMSQLQKEFWARDVVCVWILPAQDDSAIGSALALEAEGDYPIAIDLRGETGALFSVLAQGGMVVLDRKGVLRSLCDAQHVFKAVKECLSPGE